LSFSDKAFNVVGAEVLEQSDSEAVAGKKTGLVLVHHPSRHSIGS